jgi:imidazole glycerol-phosphate synthase subunit HisH
MLRKKVAIIDYKLGNLFSVQQACLYCGVDAIITNNANEILNADYAILPGIGSFGNAMENLHKMDLIKPIHDFVDSNKPLMGVCLGLQLLFTESEELGSFKGLDIVNGVVTRFPTVKQDSYFLKVPQIQWNKIRKPSENRWDNTPLIACEEEDYMYFVHSFYVIPEKPEEQLSKTVYGDINYCSSIQVRNVSAFQFHPEKSGLKGLSIYKNFFK